MNIGLNSIKKTGKYQENLDLQNGVIFINSSPLFINLLPKFEHSLVDEKRSNPNLLYMKM